MNICNTITIFQKNHKKQGEISEGNYDSQFAINSQKTKNTITINVCPNWNSALEAPYKTSVQFSDENTCQIARNEFHNCPKFVASSEG